MCSMKEHIQWCLCLTLGFLYRDYIYKGYRILKNGEAAEIQNVKTNVTLFYSTLKERERDSLFIFYMFLILNIFSRSHAEFIFLL